MSDFESLFGAWLARICDEEEPPTSVVAFNVGLFETPEGYSAYLVGSDCYDPEDSDWATRETFTPAERYFSFGREGFASWEQAHDAVIEATRRFLESPEGTESFLATAMALTVGFDDGELELVG